MNPSRPTVSVVVPCYRYGRFVPDCVRSVLDQEGVDVQVLIIDDASPDDSGSVALRLAAEDDRVEARVHRKNRGHLATYNEGLLEWAEGRYCVLLSADDLLTPGALARATSVLEANPEVGFVYGHAVRWVDGEPKPVPRLDPTGVTVWSGLDWFRRVCRLSHSVISSPEVVVRTSVQQKIGGYLPALPHSGDAEMWMRFALQSDVAFIRGVDQAYYRTHGKNMTIARVATVDLMQRKAAYDAIFDSHSMRIPDASRLRCRVNRSLAKEALWTACRSYDRRPIDTSSVNDLVEFARTAYPQTERLPEHWGLSWRRRVGPQVCFTLRPFMVSAASRSLRTTLWWRRWKHRGV